MNSSKYDNRALLVVGVCCVEEKHEGGGWTVKFVTQSAYYVPDIREDSSKLEVAFEMELLFTGILVDQRTKGNQCDL